MYVPVDLATMTEHTTLHKNVLMDFGNWEMLTNKDIFSVSMRLKE